MDKYNCDQLKNIKVPEKWIENAINIPQKKKPLQIVHLQRLWRAWRESNARRSA